MTTDETFMKEAIRLAEKAVLHGNEPFGAVLVKNGNIVCTNENQIYTKHDRTAHAELGLIHKFCAETGITNLREYTLYTSCEPCFMCSGAMVWAKLGRLVYGASDTDLGKIINGKGCECSRAVFEHSHYAPEVTAGIMREESKKVLENYFKNNEKN